MLGQLGDGDTIRTRDDDAALHRRALALPEEPTRLLLLVGAACVAAEHAEGIAVLQSDDGRLLQRAIGAPVGRSIETAHASLPLLSVDGLTSYRRRVVIGGTVATVKTLPVQIELSEAQYLVLLKHARNSSRVAARLLRVVEPETSARKGKVGPYLFTGFVTDALGLRAVAVVHAPDALPAIDLALKRAREG